MRRKRKPVKHTRGPWVVVTSASGVRMIAAAEKIDDGKYEIGMPLASTSQLTDKAQDDANARLIAAAPDLLAALERAELFVPGHCRQVRKRIADAIKLARSGEYTPTRPRLDAARKVADGA